MKKICHICDRPFYTRRHTSACVACRRALRFIREAHADPFAGRDTDHTSPRLTNHPERVARVKQYAAIIAAGGRLFE